MDIYHVWCDLEDGVGDLDFARRIDAYLGGLKAVGKIERFRLTRRKLGLAFPGLGEFHIMIETRVLAQLDIAFKAVATRSGAVEEAHFGANGLVRNARFALYRDFPDEFREEGGERF